MKLFGKRESLGAINQGLIGSGVTIEDAGGAMSDANENVSGSVAQANAAREAVDEAISALQAASQTFGSSRKKMNEGGSKLLGAAATVDQENENLNHSGLRDASLTLRSESTNVGGQMNAAQVLERDSADTIALLTTVSQALAELLNIGNSLDRSTEESAQSQSAAGGTLKGGLPTT